MTGERSDAKATSSQVTSVPTAYKAIVHGLSLLLPPLLWMLCMMCSLWVLIRVICSLAFRLPLAVGAGKIWVSGKATGT